jgi:hypothetical protein
MEATIALGAQLDIASGKEIDGLRDDVEGMFTKNRPPRPQFFTQSGTINSVSGICEIGSPSTGRIWNVLGYSIVGDLDSTTSSAGSAALYIGNRPQEGEIPMLTQVKDVALTIPASNTFGENVMWCPPSQYVFFNLTGITGPTRIVANVFIAEYREDDILNRSGR